MAAEIRNAVSRTVAFIIFPTPGLFGNTLSCVTLARSPRHTYFRNGRLAITPYVRTAVFRSHLLNPSHSPVILAPGTRLGACEIVSLLGEGGMGQVYRRSEEHT